MIELDRVRLSDRYKRVRSAFYAEPGSRPRAWIEAVFMDDDADGLVGFATLRIDHGEPLDIGAGREPWAPYETRAGALRRANEALAPYGLSILELP